MTSYDYKYTKTLVKIDNISLHFDDKVILKPITIEVKDIVRPDVCQGQIVGILGPSGIGKSQLSKILTGLNKPTTGSVTVDGKAVEPGIVGMVAQNYPLFNHRTVLGNLLIALEKSNLSKKDALAKTNEYLIMFDLVDKSKLYPSQLSGGQRQRVAIIQELLCSEHYLVMDEPFTGLDPLMKDKVCELINKISNIHEENTIFVVAHDISALVSISDTLWLLGRDRDSDGKIIPGAYIKKQYDLIERGLAWRKDISTTREFSDFVSEIKGKEYEKPVNVGMPVNSNLDDFSFYFDYNLECNNRHLKIIKKFFLVTYKL
jgi:polar amino acid transport system ATP-binding protein/sulfate transport system ATP-binding protein